MLLLKVALLSEKNDVFCNSRLRLTGGHKTVDSIVETGRLILAKVVFLFCVVMVIAKVLILGVHFGLVFWFWVVWAC